MRFRSCVCESVSVGQYACVHMFLYVFVSGMCSMFVLHVLWWRCSLCFFRRDILSCFLWSKHPTRIQLTPHTHTHPAHSHTLNTLRHPNTTNMVFKVFEIGSPILRAISVVTLQGPWHNTDTLIDTRADTERHRETHTHPFGAVCPK